MSWNVQKNYTIPVGTVVELDVLAKSKSVSTSTRVKIFLFPLGGKHRSGLTIGTASDKSFVNPALCEKLIRIILVWIDRSSGFEQTSSSSRSDCHILWSGHNSNRLKWVRISLS
jgi:hypothetical protein